MKDAPAPALLFVLTGQSNAGQQGKPGQVAPVDAAPATRDLGTSDGIHFNSSGVVTLGRRLAEEWLRLAGGCGE